ncbi:hypothetical protein NS206_09020, partial [Microbacterium testaceum]
MVTEPADTVGVFMVTVRVATVRKPPLLLPSESLRGKRVISQLPGAAVAGRVMVRFQVPLVAVPATRSIEPKPSLWSVVVLLAEMVGVLTPEGSLALTVTVKVALPVEGLSVVLSTVPLINVGPV